MIQFLKMIFNIKTKYLLYPFVYIDGNHNSSENMTDTIQWLDYSTIEHFSEELAMKEYIEKFKNTKKININKNHIHFF